MTNTRDQRTEGSGQFNRRDLLQWSARGAVVLGAGTLLQACGGGATGVTTGSSSASAGAGTGGLPNTTGNGTPVRGGTITVGGITGGASETLNPLRSTSNADAIRSFQLFDRLFQPTPDLKGLQPQLALSAESNKEATVWTIRLRDGVAFHNGKPLTADDVIYSIRFWADPEGNAAGQVATIDMKRLRKRDRLTVEVPLLTPIQDWAMIPTTRLNCILPEGTKAESLNTNPIGTGPFKFKSFDPGKSSVFVANPDYWEQGKPYVDTVVFDTSFTDDTARQNALLSGAIDVMPQAPYLMAKSHLQTGDTTVFGSACPAPYMFIMRVDQGPLADPRVRQALRLVADRQALVDGALAGFGTVADDLLGPGTKYYDTSLKRSRDVEQAKSLLKAAGQPDLKLTLQTSAVAPGYTESATLLASQAKEAGITINLETAQQSVYYTPAGGFLNGSFRQDNYLALSSLAAYYMSYMSRQASLNETHWGEQKGGARAEKLLSEAIGETDEAKATEKWAEVQKLQFDEGGLLYWASPDFVNMAATNVRGVSEGPTGFLNNGSLRDGWLQS